MIRSSIDSPSESVRVGPGVDRLSGLKPQPRRFPKRTTTPGGAATGTVAGGFRTAFPPAPPEAPGPSSVTVAAISSPSPRGMDPGGTCAITGAVVSTVAPAVNVQESADASGFPGSDSSRAEAFTTRRADADAASVGSGADGRTGV